MAPDSDAVGPLQSRLRDSRLYYGWYVVAGCFVLSLMTSGTIYSFSVFLGPVLETFDQSYASTSLVFSVQSLVTFGGAAVLGLAIDRYGLRRLLLIAAVLLAGGLAAASQAPTFLGVVAAYGIIAGAGLGITFVVAYTTPPRWFDRRRGLATGVAVSGWGVGIVAMPPLVDALIRRVGWQATYLALGGLFVAAIAIAVLLLADRPADLDIDTGDEFTTGQTAAATGTQTSIRTQAAVALETVRTRLFGLVFVGLLLAFVPSIAVIVYMVEFAEAAGVSRRVGVLAVSVVGVMNVVAKFTAGGVADYVGMDRAMAVCAGLMAVTTALLVVYPTPRAILLLAAGFGLGYGGVAALMSPLLAELFGTADLSTLFGVTAVGFAVTGITVPTLVGYGVDTAGTYDVPFLAAAVVGALAVAAFVAIRLQRSA